MRILHIGEYASGGVATYINTLLKYQVKEKNQVKLIVSDENSESFNNFKSLVIRKKYKRSLLSIIKYIFSVNKLIREYNPEIIHLHGTFAGLIGRVSFILDRLFFREKKSKLIYCSHGWSFLMDTSNWKKKVYFYVERVLEKVTDSIINISQFEHEEALKMGMPKEKMKLINSGVETEIKKIENISIKLSENHINLLFVGRFDKAKGIDILLKTFETNKFENIRLYLIGDKVLNDLDINIPKNVFHLGWVMNEVMDAYYKQFDAVIIPSRWEGFGLVAAEAMKNSKAIIVSNKGNLPNFIEYNNGLIFNIDSPKALVKILVSLEKERLKEMGRNGEKLFLQKYTSNHMMENIDRLYKSLI
ncbi:glycosyltransferase [Gottfriedia sp. NPDC057948]|uniref:glycosyltransferase n=1 Tax=Gottfriedia sp. NPDC057948 TaxID=3346287 RepID=UPI0036DB71FE